MSVYQDMGDDSEECNDDDDGNEETRVMRVMIIE